MGPPSRLAQGVPAVSGLLAARSALRGVLGSRGSPSPSPSYGRVLVGAHSVLPISQPPSHSHSDRLLPHAVTPSNTPSLPPFRRRNDSLRSRIVPAGGCSSACLCSVLTRLPCLFLPPFVGATNLHFPGQLNAHADERAHKAITCELRAVWCWALGSGSRRRCVCAYLRFSYCLLHVTVRVTVLLGGWVSCCCSFILAFRLPVFVGVRVRVDASRPFLILRTCAPGL